MMTHTPGPWDDMKVGYIYKKGIMYPLKVDETRLEGESWLSMRKRLEPEFKSRDREAEANAKLMTASPLIFDALKMVATKITPGDALGDTFADFNSDEVDQIFSAIKHVTG